MKNKYHFSWRGTVGGVESNRRPPSEVLAERDRVCDLDLTPSQQLLGDPPPGRSALDKQVVKSPAKVI